MFGQTEKAPFFRVGINEGVIAKREDLDTDTKKLEMYTDSLIGCVGLVVANKQYVFMAHVSSGHPGDTLYRDADRYLREILKWMEMNGGTNDIQIGLASNAGTGHNPTLLAFEKTCETHKLPVVSRGKTGQCMVEIEGDIFSLKDRFRLPHNPCDVMGTLTRPDLVSKYRIHANTFGFGRVAHGDHNESLEDIINKAWPKQARSPELYSVVKDLVDVVTEPNKPPDYKNAGELLQQIYNKTLHCGKDRLDICIKVVEILCQTFEEKENLNIPSIIDTAVNSVLAAKQKRDYK